MKNNLSFLISGGGTGGHIFPAIAIGKALQARYPNASIEYVGAKDKMEMQKVPEAGFKITGLWISGIDRKLSLKNLAFPFKLLSSLMKSMFIINRTKPDVVIGVGGFASGPLLYAANLRNIPTLVQEQNSYPGITNKLLASKATKICVAFDGMDRFFSKDKIVVTGNPIRQQLLICTKTTSEARAHFGLKDVPTILIIGGSLGARTINKAIENNLNLLKDEGVQIIWQTGKFYQEKNEVLGIQTIFITEMELAYRAADVVISRAGASSLSELSALGKASILVPSPNVTEDHQTKNAMALVTKSAAEMVTDANASRDLVPHALQLIVNNDKIESLQNNIKALGKVNATNEIVIEIEKLLTK
ncbi:MAG: UDP-N-acetylglucosamine--N-acetylmuramyl-(pentapeptide) pyrophosphoryl-undecaprenol N-acetylglucosamine transferase [Bacteroidia bacterium]|jgi:UDP-N-acetylglucosamine--N-acetylmuramyl-(pentapeptide) pyrophosphoryl-undecaprenol N-acetylglucosamine transferase